MLTSPRPVLFDLDGVLIDSRAAITGCMNAALESVGTAPRAPEALYRFIGPPLLDSFSELAGAAVAARCLTAYRERYAIASLEETVLVPGILEVVAALAGERRLGVATSKPVAYARPLVDHLGLAPYFDVVAGPELDEPAEAKTVTVARALGAMGSADAPLVGDRHHDVAAALANGIECVGVLWGIGDEAELREAGATRIVATPSELPANL
jgi:phosphoglycolate phosphatase